MKNDRDKVDGWIYLIETETKNQGLLEIQQKPNRCDNLFLGNNQLYKFRKKYFLSLIQYRTNLPNDFVRPTRSAGQLHAVEDFQFDFLKHLLFLRSQFFSSSIRTNESFFSLSMVSFNFLISIRDFSKSSSSSEIELFNFFTLSSDCFCRRSKSASTKNLNKYLRIRNKTQVLTVRLGPRNYSKQL
ncbi:hypothetical protein BpHYR1_040127 [Brachionus plicatilis]|uniref:Uncharacterized protein n=1 Tax=Brachionus plicatilis TaxID=10195 RepID=A0A3M7RBM1_BRAPC|nr:hypothetical protein BpHYR1_040127 [Brachionus plicatilis]